MTSNKSVEHWKSNPAGPGSGVVARIGAIGKVVYSGRLDKGPYAGKWIRIVADERDVLIGDSDQDVGREMEARYGGAKVKRLMGTRYEARSSGLPFAER